jgi:hypothetical protein
MFEDPLIPILVFLAVTGMVLALASLSGAKGGQVRVRILRRAGDGSLAPVASAERIEPPVVAGKAEDV